MRAETQPIAERPAPGAIAAAILVALIAMTVLIGGWWGGSQFLVRIRPGFAAMVPTTAVCLLLCASGVLSLVRWPHWRLLPLCAAALAAGIASFDLMAHFVVEIRNLDAALLKDDLGSDRMSIGTAILSIAAAACVVVLTVPGRFPRWVFQILATAGLLAALVALVGYIFDSTALYAVFIFTTMALHTAVAFGALFFALLFLRPSASWAGLLLGAGAGSHSARRLLPIFVLASFVFAFGALVLVKGGILDPEFTLSLLAIVMATLASIAILRNAEIENRSQRKLLSTLNDLEVLNSEKALLLREVYHRVKNNLQQIGSMLRIEKRVVNDPRLSESFDELADRVRTMGFVHQLLIASETPTQIDIQEFLTVLTGAISKAHDLPARGIHLETKADQIEFHLDIAISIGLLTNELVMNAVKHAQHGADGLRIGVLFKSSDDALLLEVSDNGEGSHGAPKTEGTGSLIVRSAVAQLHGSLTYPDTVGTRAVVSIPPDINKHERYV
jgi:two-component sensor histidine kinase